MDWRVGPPPAFPFNAHLTLQKILPLTLHHQRTYTSYTMYMAKKSRVILRDSGRFTVVSDLTIDCDDAAAKSDGDLGECGDEPITVQPEESVVVDPSLDLGEDLPQGKISLIV